MGRHGEVERGRSPCWCMRSTLWLLESPSFPINTYIKQPGCLQTTKRKPRPTTSALTRDSGDQSRMCKECKERQMWRPPNLRAFQIRLFTVPFFSVRCEWNWAEYKTPVGRGGHPTLLTSPPLPKGILFSPQFRSHQETEMAAQSNWMIDIYDMVSRNNRGLWTVYHYWVWRRHVNLVLGLPEFDQQLIYHLENTLKIFFSANFFCKSVELKLKVL